MEYNYNIIQFLLYRSDNDRKKLLETTRQIIVDGIGSCHLDKITEKSFLDREDDYYTRICYYVENDPRKAKYLFMALIEWYESWKDEFSEFTGNEERLYAMQRLKTWAYCMINGLPQTYARLSNEVSVSLTELELKDLHMIDAIRNKIYENRHFIDKTQSDSESIAKMEKEALKTIQQNIQEEDEQRVKDVLKHKRLIFYTNGRWKYDSLQAIQYKYNLDSIHQESALDMPKSKKQCDYIIFVTLQANHAVYYKLLEMYGKSKIFLVGAQNPELAMDDFIEQLLGYRRD